MQAVACTTASMVKRQKTTRVHKVHLKFVGISPRTLNRYSTAVLHYFAYLGVFNLIYPESPEELDHSLSEYICCGKKMNHWGTHKTWFMDL